MAASISHDRSDRGLPWYDPPSLSDRQFFAATARRRLTARIRCRTAYEAMAPSPSAISSASRLPRDRVSKGRADWPLFGAAPCAPGSLTVTEGGALLKVRKRDVMVCPYDDAFGMVILCYRESLRP
jgi:hypothetical protein